MLQFNAFVKCYLFFPTGRKNAPAPNDLRNQFPHPPPTVPLWAWSPVATIHSVQIRTYVTNKLIEESTNPDAKIRMRSLELLGKIGDVGLFIERSEVTVKHKTTIELQASIKERISKLLQVRSKAEDIQELPVKAVSLREAADDMLDDTPVTLVVDNTKTDGRDFRT
jgi:hypothetical protein